MKSSSARFLKRLLWTGLLSIGASPPLWGGVVIDRVAAVVNREVITQSELDEARAPAQKAKQEGGGGSVSLERGLEQEWLGRLIEKRLILQEAKREGVRLTDEELDLALKDIEERNRFSGREALKRAVTQENLSWEKYLEDLRNQLILLKLMNRKVDAAVLASEEEVRAYYDGRPEEFKLPDQIRLRQILIRLPSSASPEEAERARRKAERVIAEANGGEDFERLAETFSDGAERRQGGDLGFFKKGELAPEIDQIVFNLEPGAISPVIRTGLGFHLFKVEERQSNRRQTFEKVRKEAEEGLLAEKRESARRKWLDEVWRRSFVEIK